MIYFVRHGESLANLHGRFGGKDDSPLTMSGEAQAAAIGRQLATQKIQPSLIVSSTLTRSWRTAILIAGTIGYPKHAVRKDGRLDEYDYGSLTGQMKQGVDSAKFMSTPDREDPKHFYERVRTAWNEYCEWEGDVLIVGHAFVRHMLECVSNGGDIAFFHDYAPAKNAPLVAAYEPIAI